MKKMVLFLLLTVLLLQVPVPCYAASESKTESGITMDSVKEKAGDLVDKTKEIFLDIWTNIGVEESSEDDIFVSQQVKSRIYFVIVIVAVVGVILWLIVDFIKMSWKQKGSCLVTLIKVVIICTLLFYGCYYVAVKM